MSRSEQLNPIVIKSSMFVLSKVNLLNHLLHLNGMQNKSIPWEYNLKGELIIVLGQVNNQ